MKFKQCKQFPKRKVLVFEDKAGDVLTINSYGEQGEGDVFIHVNNSGSVWLKRRRAIRLALMILDELDPLHTWA